MAERPLETYLIKGSGQRAKGNGTLDSLSMERVEQKWKKRKGRQSDRGHKDNAGQ